MSTIETTYQAGRTAVGTVVRLATGRVADRVATGWTITGIYSPGPVPRGLYAADLPATVLHNPAQPAPAGVIDREAVDAAIGEVLFNASNYPERVQARILGQDTSPLRTKVVDAVLAVLPGRSAAQVKAEGLREAARFIRERPNGSWVKGPVTDDYSPDLGYYGEADFLDARADELEREDRR